MRTNKKLAVESLERREVFASLAGVEGLAPTQVTDQEIIDALNAGTQLTADALVVAETGNVGIGRFAAGYEPEVSDGNGGTTIATVAFHSTERCLSEGSTPPALIPWREVLVD